MFLSLWTTGEEQGLVSGSIYYCNRLCHVPLQSMGRGWSPCTPVVRGDETLMDVSGQRSAITILGTL